MKHSGGLSRAGRAAWAWLLAFGASVSSQAAEPAARAAPMGADGRLPAAPLAVEGLTNDRFVGAPLGVEALVLYRTADPKVVESTSAIGLRLVGTGRLGPFTLSGGLFAASTGVTPVFHVEAISFVRNGWEAGLGGGYPEGGTLRFAIPLNMPWLPTSSDIVRIRGMAGYLRSVSAGLGVEVTL